MYDVRDEIDRPNRLNPTITTTLRTGTGMI